MRPRPALSAFFLLLIILFAAGENANAAQELVFKSPDLGPTQTILLKDYLDQNKPLPAIEEALIARADLNEDGIDEIILRHACKIPENICAHEILALSGEKFIKIGEIEARILALGQGYNAGIRTIWAYKNDTNHFEYDIYVWEPAARQYIIKK